MLLAKNIKRARRKKNRVAGIPWRNRYLVPYCLGALHTFHHPTRGGRGPPRGTCGVVHVCREPREVADKRQRQLLPQLIEAIWKRRAASRCVADMSEKSNRWARPTSSISHSSRIKSVLSLPRARQDRGINISEFPGFHETSRDSCESRGGGGGFNEESALDEICSQSNIYYNIITFTSKKLIKCVTVTEIFDTPLILMKRTLPQLLPTYGWRQSGVIKMVLQCEII